MRAEAKLHPYLASAWPERRATVIRAYAERLVAFEVTSERIEERHYDEQERLRLHRVVDRQVQRGTLRERYAAVLNDVADGTMHRSGAESRVRGYLEEDLSAAVAIARRGDLAAALSEYRAVLPEAEWPTLLCMAPRPFEASALRAELAATGFEERPSSLLARFGIVSVLCPPELSIAESIALRMNAVSLADAETPVAYPTPRVIDTATVDTRGLLGITSAMIDADQGQATIAVLDTGFDKTHPAFAGRPVAYHNFTKWPALDEAGHGTAVAFVAAGDGTFCRWRCSGVAPRSHLVVGKVLHSNGPGSLEDVLEGMAWAVFEQRADVLSLSISDPHALPNGLSIWARACDEAFHQGTLVVVAAGNLDNAYPETISVPADATTAVTVGAIDTQQRLAPFSAKGSLSPQSPIFGKPNCVAPGKDVTAARSSASSEGAGLLNVEDGTSMAAPAVAGCLALLKSRARSLGWEIPPTELRDLFYEACRPLCAEDGEPYSADFEVGRGLVNMTDAMRLLEERTPALAPEGQGRQETPAVTGLGSRVRDAGRRRPVSTQPLSIPAARAPDTCYGCGRSFLTKVGTFSDAQRCATCGAPLCVLCWGKGERGCREHPQSATPPFVTAPPAATTSPSAAFAPGEHSMTDSPGPDGCRLDDDAEMAAQMFLSRFETKVQAKNELEHPITGRPTRRQQRQSFVRAFGEVVRFNFAGGVPLLRQSLLTVTGVALGEGALERALGSCVPNADLLKSIGGQDGLDLQDEGHHIVGIFSPVGWPERWRRLAHVGASVEFHLISTNRNEEAGEWWEVEGPAGSPFRDFFVPEEPDERRVRAARGLDREPRLKVPAGYVPLQEFCEKYHVGPADVGAAVEASHGRFSLVSHPTRPQIQRSFM